MKFYILINSFSIYNCRIPKANTSANLVTKKPYTVYTVCNDYRKENIPMKKRIKAYLDFIDKILSHDIPVTACFDIDSNHRQSAKKDVIPTRKEYEALLQRHLEQIQFFQHERLIHLIVTVLFAALTFAVFFVLLFSPSPGLFILLLALLILLVPYIMHYFLLENGVQKMYLQYDEILKKIRE